MLWRAIAEIHPLPRGVVPIPKTALPRSRYLVTPTDDAPYAPAAILSRVGFKPATLADNYYLTPPGSSRKVKHLTFLLEDDCKYVFPVYGKSSLKNF